MSDRLISLGRLLQGVLLNILILYLLLLLVLWLIPVVKIHGAISAPLELIKLTASLALPSQHVVEINAPLSQNELELTRKKVVLEVSLVLKPAANSNNRLILDVRGLRNLVEGSPVIHPLVENLHTVLRPNQAVIPAYLLLFILITKLTAYCLLEMGPLLDRSVQN